MKRFAKLALGGVALLALGSAGLATWYRTAPGATAFAGGETVALGQYKGIDPSGVPASLKQASLVQRGEYLVRAADCAPCHTAAGQPEFSGGRAFNLPFGKIYSSNITPDRQHGIGGWSDQEFIRAVKHGVRRDGTHLYPAMPYTSYAAMTDEDALAIRAYLASVPGVARPAPANSLSFPFNQRGVLGGWKWFFAKDETFRPNPARSPEWNRGAYLAEAMGHCGECHTPRGLGYQLNNRRKFAGALTGGWMAHNLTSERESGIGAWSDDALASYLTTGFAAGHGAAGGPMGEAVDHGLRHLTREDIAALISYLRSVPGIRSDAGPRRLTPAAEGFAKASAASPGEALFAANCAGCHDWTGVSPLSPYARLTGLQSVNDPSAANVVQSVLWGISRRPPDGMAPMPAFGTVLNDREVAALSNYVAQRFGTKDANLSADDVKRLRREGRH